MTIDAEVRNHMNAEKKNLVNEHRSKLEDVLPLRTPYSLFIDPCNLCNFKCKFCAMQTTDEELDFKKQLMSMELYEKIVDDIASFPDKLKMLRISQHGEPLLHPELPEMIRYAKQKNVSEFIEIVSNGSKLNPRLNKELVESGLDRIRISIEEISGEGYREIAGVSIDFDQLIANIKDLFEQSNRMGKALEVYVKIVDVAVDTKEKEETFYRLFGDICHKIWIDHIVPVWSGWGDLENRFELQQMGVHGQTPQVARVCPFPFYSLTIAPDGIANVCCSDWRRKLVIGDLKRQSLMDVWKGDLLKKFWIDMLSGNKDRYEMCAQCVYPVYNSTDNIDAYAEEILKRM
nr:radical SAM/SPASM domain-containing protein [uncultured Oscillibacter sp.]